MTERYLQGADGLRGFACLIVLVIHSVALSFPSAMAYLAGCGKIGVWLFFVLSAFLLTYQLERRGFRLASLIDYSVGRFLRIFPAFAIVLLFYYFCGTTDIERWDDVRSALFFQRGFTHLWTIPVEFKAYLVIPIFAASFLLLRSRIGTNGVLIGAILALAIHQWFFPYELLPENSIDTIWYLSSFLVGSASAVLLPVWRRLGTRWTGMVASMGIAIVVVVTPPFGSFIFGWPPSPVLMNKVLFFSLIWAFFLLSVLANDNYWRRLFSTRIFTLVGTWSYSIYLIHWYFVVTMSSWSNHYLAASAGFLASILAGFILHVTIEKPAERMRRLVRSWFATKPFQIRRSRPIV